MTDATPGAEAQPGTDTIKAPQPGATRTPPTVDVVAQRQAILNGVQNDEAARTAYFALPTAHQQIVLGAAASLQRAIEKTGEERAAAVADTKRSIVGGPFEQPYPPGHPSYREGERITFKTQAPALAGGAAIWAALAKAAGV